MSSRRLIRSRRSGLTESRDNLAEVRRYGWLHDYHMELDQGPDRSITSAGPDPFLVQRAIDRHEMPAAPPPAITPVVVNVNINLGDLLSRVAAGRSTASECLEEMVESKLTDQPHEQPSDVFHRLNDQRTSRRSSVLTEDGWYPDHRDIEKSKVRYGVFKWNQAGRYPEQDAIEIFDSEKRAETYVAKKSSGQNWVVRTVR